MENQDFVTAPQKYGTANGGYATRNEYGFVENQDFTTISKNLENGGRRCHLCTLPPPLKEFVYE